MSSLLCCAQCWHWFKVGASGSLVEAQAPKNFVKGALRFHRSNGSERVVPVTFGDVKRKRRDWQVSSFLSRHFQAGVPLRKELVVICILLAYLAGILTLCYAQLASGPFSAMPSSYLQAPTITVQPVEGEEESDPQVMPRADIGE